MVWTTVAKFKVFQNVVYALSVVNCSRAGEILLGIVGKALTSGGC